MDNQQERLDAARLAMFLDCDGCLTMRIIQRAKNRRGNVAPYISFVNTNTTLMQWVAETLTRLNVPYNIQTVDMPKYVPNRSRLKQVRISIQGIKRVMKLIPYVTPFLVGKKTQAEAIAEYCESRLNQSVKATYTDHELGLANLIRSLNSNKAGNWRPISSTSIRQAQELQTELTGMMCSDLHGDMQSTAEMSVPA